MSRSPHCSSRAHRKRFSMAPIGLFILLLAATGVGHAQTTATANIVSYGNNVINANIPRFEAYNVPNTPSRAADIALSQALPLKIAHTYINTYDTYYAPIMYDYSISQAYPERFYPTLDALSAESDAILITLEKNGDRTQNETTGFDLLEGDQISFDQFKTAITTLLTAWKAHSPKIEYIEVLNETNPYPDGTYTPRYNYYQIYQAYQQIIDGINATLPAGVPSIKIGPNHSLQYFRDFFLPLYKADPSTTKHVDFVGSHQYLFQGNTVDFGNPNAQTSTPPTYPIDLWSQRSDATQGYDAAFASAGISTNTPVFETEFGGYPATDGSQAQQSQVVGAGSLTEDWIFLNKWHDAVGFWFIEEQENFFSQIYAGGDGGIPLAPYNMRAMLQKLKTAEVYSSDPVIDNRGYGVYQIATVDSTGAAILVWNYSGFDGIQPGQPQPTTYNTIVSIYNLPSVFYNGYHLDQYQVDLTTSNYYGNSSRPGLQNISSFDVPGQNYMTQGATLGPNAATLYVLTPNAN